MSPENTKARARQDRMLPADDGYRGRQCPYIPAVSAHEKSTGLEEVIRICGLGQNGIGGSHRPEDEREEKKSDGREEDVSRLEGAHVNSPTHDSLCE